MQSDVDGKCYYETFAITYSFVLKNYEFFDMLPKTEAKLALETVRDGILEAKGALVVYDQLVERVVPWKEFSDILIGLDKFREDYSTESALLITEIKTLMTDGINAYFSASESVYEWTGTAITDLGLYIKLFSHYDVRRAAAQRKLLIDLLGSGVEKMSAAQKQLDKSSKSFNRVYSELSTLRKRFEDEFDETSEFFQVKMELIRSGSHFWGSSLFGLSGYFFGEEIGERKYVNKLKRELRKIEMFYYHLHLKIEQALNNIVDTKKILGVEIQHITEMKIQVGDTKVFVGLDEVPDMRDAIIETAKDLISKCEQYRKKHVEKIESSWNLSQKEN